MQIDTRFLTIHPATTLWHQQRDQCERCAHFALREGDEGESIMRCKAVRVAPRRSRPTLGAYCIDARSEGAACGPDAILYKEITP